jgi:hypothetical protein
LSITDFEPKYGSKSTLNDTTEPMKLFLAHPMVFGGSIWKIKSGWFLFVMPLGLSVATEIVLTAGVHRTGSQPKFGSKSTLNDTTEPMKLFLAHTMVFVGSIWKIKSGWFLFVMPLRACQLPQILCADCWGPSLI